MLVFESQNLNQSIDKTNCTLASIPSELFKGVNQPNDQFLGLSNIYEVLSNFKDESEFMKNSLSVNFLNISESGIDQHINKTSSKIQLFSSQYKGNYFLVTSDKKALDPTGSTQKPLAIQNFTSFINNDIESEIKLYLMAISKLILSANKGQEFTKGDLPFALN